MTNTKPFPTPTELADAMFAHLTKLHPVVVDDLTSYIKEFGMELYAAVQAVVDEYRMEELSGLLTWAARYIAAH